MQLRQAVIAELEVACPLAVVERPTRRPDGASHVIDCSVGGLAGHLFAGGVDHVERRAAARVLQLAVDQHSLVAGQYTGFGLHFRHGDSFTNYWESVSTSAEPNDQHFGGAERSARWRSRRISPVAEPNDQPGGGAERSARRLDPRGVPKLCEELVVVIAADDVVRNRDANCCGGLD